jgi:hypothetical protein
MSKKESGIEDVLVAILGGATKQAVQLQKDPKKWLDSRIRIAMTPVAIDSRFQYVFRNNIEYVRKTNVNRHYKDFCNKVRQLGVDEYTGKQKVNRRYGKRIRWNIEELSYFLDVKYTEKDTLFSLFAKYLKKMADNMDDKLSDVMPNKPVSFQMFDMIMEEYWISKYPCRKRAKREYEIIKEFKSYRDRIEWSY